MRSVLMAVALAAACNSGGRDAEKSKQQAQPAAQVRLFTEPEIAELEGTLMKRLAANAARTCVRPLLHGSPRPGSANDDILALAEPTGELANCMHELTTAEQGGKLADLIEQNAPHLLELDKRCGKVIADTVVAIAAHEDACSPYQPGRRAEPQAFMPILRASHMVGLRARVMAKAGDPHGAMWLIADALRAFQDLSRGHVNMIASMITAATYGTLLKAADAILANHKLSPAAATEIGAALDAVLASEPSFGQTLAGERDFMGLYMALARLKPADWVPPGGTSKALRELAESSPNAEANVDPRDEAALLLASAERLGDEITKKCPDTASYASCVKAFSVSTVAADTPGADAMKNPRALIEKLVATTGGKDTPEIRDRVRRDVQRMVLDTLASVATPSYQDYAGKRAGAIAHITATRFAVEVEVEIARSGTCPSATDLESPRLKAMRSPAILGDAVVATLDKGTLRLAAPAWTYKAEGRTWTIKCR